MVLGYAPPQTHFRFHLAIKIAGRDTCHVRAIQVLFGNQFYAISVVVQKSYFKHARRSTKLLPYLGRPCCNVPAPFVSRLGYRFLAVAGELSIPPGIDEGNRNLRNPPRSR